MYVKEDNRSTERIFKPGFHAVRYIGIMPRLVQIETWFFGIIHFRSFFTELERGNTLKAK